MLNQNHQPIVMLINRKEINQILSDVDSTNVGKDTQAHKAIIGERVYQTSMTQRRKKGCNKTLFLIARGYKTLLGKKDAEQLQRSNKLMDTSKDYKRRLIKQSGTQRNI